MRHRSHPPLGLLLLAGVLALAAAGWRVVASEGGGGAMREGVLAWSPAPESADPPVALASAGDPAPLVEEEVHGTWVLAGRVTDDLGRPLSGAIVRAGARQVATDDDGMFALAGLPPLAKGARVAAVAHADWYASERVELRAPIEPGDVLPPQEFKLGRGASLAGQVLRPDGTAVAGARIVATSNHGRSSQPREPFVADEQCTGWDGRFLFECVEAGTWTVSAEASGLVGCRMKLEVLAGDAAACPPFVLAETASLDGRVVDRSGAPVARAEVRFALLDPDGERESPPYVRPPVGDTDDGSYSPRPIVNVPYPRTSAADGSFHIQDLTPGMWRVVAVPPPGMLGPVPGVVRVELGPGAALAVDVPLAEPRHLRGVVVDEAGQPVRDLEVTAEEQGLLAWRRLPLTARTDPLGRFEFEVAPEASVELTAIWQVRRESGSLQVEPGDDEPVKLQLWSLDRYGPQLSLPIDPPADTRPP